MKKEEALQVIKAKMDYYESDRRLRGAIETLIPELAESEDERIRKFLIDMVKREIGFAGFPSQGQVLAYLEKQRENPKSADSIPSNCASDAKCENRWHKVGDSLPDSAREVICKDAIGNFFIGRYYKESGSWEVSMYDDVDKSNEDNPPVIMWCDIPSEKQKEPDGTWTEEDDAKVKAMCEEGDLKPSERAWLKELKNRIVKKEQKPVEWSEEDKHRCGDAIYFLETAKKHYASTSEIELTIEWLKSLQPQAKQEQKPEAKLTGWVARDRNGEISVYEDYPERDSNGQFWLASGYMSIDEKSFPDLKWEDEPMEVEVTIKKKRNDSL